MGLCWVVRVRRQKDAAHLFRWVCALWVAPSTSPEFVPLAAPLLRRVQHLYHARRELLPAVSGRKSRVCLVLG